MTDKEFKAINDELDAKRQTHFSLIRMDDDSVAFSMLVDPYPESHQDLEDMFVSLLKQGTDKQREQIRHILLAALSKDAVEEISLILQAEKNKREGNIQ